MILSRFIGDLLAPVAAIIFVASFLLLEITYVLIVGLSWAGVLFFLILNSLRRYYDRSSRK